MTSCIALDIALLIQRGIEIIDQRRRRCQTEGLLVAGVERYVLPEKPGINLVGLLDHGGFGQDLEFRTDQSSRSDRSRRRIIGREKVEDGRRVQRLLSKLVRDPEEILAIAPEYF